MESEGESINKGRNHGAAFKQLIQAREQQVRGNNGAGALVAVRDDLKNQLGLIFVEDHLAEFIQNQHICFFPVDAIYGPTGRNHVLLSVPWSSSRRS